MLLDNGLALQLIALVGLAGAAMSHTEEIQAFQAAELHFAHGCRSLLAAQLPLLGVLLPSFHQTGLQQPDHI